MSLSAMPLLAVETTMYTNDDGGLAILIVGMLVIAWIVGPLLAFARAQQWRYFRACERAYDITIHDPHVWAMRVEDTFRRDERYWTLMVDEQADPALEAVRRKVLRLFVAGIWVSVIGFIVLFGFASLAGLD